MLLADYYVARLAEMASWIAGGAHANAPRGCLLCRVIVDLEPGERVVVGAGASRAAGHKVRREGARLVGQDAQGGEERGR